MNGRHGRPVVLAGVLGRQGIGLRPALCCLGGWVLLQQSRSLKMMHAFLSALTQTQACCVVSMLSRGITSVLVTAGEVFARNLFLPAIDFPSSDALNQFPELPQLYALSLLLLKV